MLSIVMCSRDDARFSRSSASYARVLAGVEHEIVRITDARGMCEGYNRGIARARGDRLLLSHDDVEILGDDFAENVARHFERFDLLGVAGTTRLIGPAWHLAGPPWVFGQILHNPAPGKPLRVDIYGVPGRAVADVQAVDGVLIGVRRRVWEQLRFDEQTFDGFHLYDIDFSFRAHLAGFACGVACDLDVFHFEVAQNTYQTPEWLAAAEKFYAKHRAALPPPPEKLAEWSQAWVRVPDARAAARVMRPDFF